MFPKPISAIAHPHASQPETNRQKRTSLPLRRPHELMRSGRIIRIQKGSQHSAEDLEVDRLGNIGVKPRFSTLRVHVAQDVRRQGDDGQVRVLVFSLPAADFLTGLVAVFIGHVEVALRVSASVQEILLKGLTRMME